MILIVGLGNPGKKYENSRHNMGFMVVDALARKWRKGRVKWGEDRESKSLIICSKLPIANYPLPIILAKPQVFMNASGFAVKSLITNYKLPITNLWVIHDDLDLPLGKIKIVKGRGAAGHHGVESIIRELKAADFLRFRIGIGRPLKNGKWEVGAGNLVNKNVKHKEVEEYVLGSFSGKEMVEAEKVIKKAVEAVILTLRDRAKEEGVG